MGKIYIRTYVRMYVYNFFVCIIFCYMYICMSVYHIHVEAGRESHISWITVTDGHELPHGSYGSWNSTGLETT